MNTAPAQDTGRMAVITGASSGIGEATARALAASGHRLALLARRADRIRALADELGNGAVAIQADVTDRDSLVKAAPAHDHQRDPRAANGTALNHRRSHADRRPRSSASSALPEWKPTCPLAPAQPSPSMQRSANQMINLAVHGA